MTTETTKVNAEHATDLARAMFVAQKGKEDATSFKDVKPEASKLARQVLRALQAKGYTLTKT